MTALRYAAAVLCSAWLVLSSAPTPAQDVRAKTEYEPYVGQHGKDVVWVPTPQSLVNRMLNLARLRRDDYLIDLGAGDGRTVISAAKRGTRALGIEYNADMVALARRNAEQAGVADKAQFREADLFQTDLSQATVITMFLLPEINVKLRPSLLKLKPGTRVVSNSFRMGNWKPDAMTTATKDCTDYCTAYLWVVPAPVAGTWDTPHGRLTLEQRFQYVTGTLHGRDGAVAAKGKLSGAHIALTAGATKYEGRVSGNTIHGTATASGDATQWLATKR
ncbi:MAG: SAM-dependent methyltransferase [Rhodospirillaceae bacterium]